MWSSPQGQVPGTALLSASSPSPDPHTPADAHRGDDELCPQGSFCWALSLARASATASVALGTLGASWHSPAGIAGSRAAEQAATGVLQCSVTCGMGAIWRTVRCSTGSDDGCVVANKPVPARRCSLRPCSSWRVGNWSKVNRRAARGCGVLKNPEANEGRWCLPHGQSIAFAQGMLLSQGSQRQRVKIYSFHRVTEFKLLKNPRI